jgi:hypothetical protein
LSQTVANVALHFFPIEEADSAGKNVLLGGGHHASKLAQAALAAFEGVDRFAQDLHVASELAGG